MTDSHDIQERNDPEGGDAGLKTQIMIQPPVATNLIEIANLWADMQAEIAQPPLPEETKAYEGRLRDLYRDPKAFILTGVRMFGAQLPVDANVGEVVAFMVSRLEEGPPRHGRIVDVYVRPSLRGNELGRRMIEAAAGWMRAQGCTFLEAGTLTSNRRGMAFLARGDFQLHSSVLRKRL